MANYIYSTHIYKENAEVINENPNNATWLADFETNHKATAEDISGIVIQELTFDIDGDYSTFVDYINGDITWDDVKYIEQPDHYELYIVTISPL